ncbi:universal stress protein [Chitinophaga sp. YIM B06452]|uniref:universal stress protein n=1 Tax=Chitinophaga sp. YIM B06452 TaxID=3082158 RepID=UPI0031FEC560
MKSLLILTDFSEAAFRAAEYACGIAPLLQIERIILYHAYQSYVGGTEIPVMEDSHQLYLENMESLGLLHDRVKTLAGSAIEVDMVAKEAFLSDALNEYSRQEKVAAIVMGVSGKSGFEELLLGSTTSQILETSEAPVLVVPQDALVGRPVETIIFATDLKDVDRLSGDKLDEFLSAFKAKLYIVNVFPETEEKYSPETFEAITGLHRLLEKYDPTFGYISRDDIVEGILTYAAERQASMIMAVPKKHGAFSSLFHKSISKNLAYNSNVPLLFFPGFH